MDLELLKYPVGKFKPEDPVSEDRLKQCIKVIHDFPEKLTTEIRELNESELGYRYREDGWTIRQVVHHCADSHMNAFIRTRLAMTEDNPRILPYKQGEWAKLPDVAETPVSDSLEILKGLHARWYCLLSHMDENDFKRTYFHPEQNRAIPLKVVTANYAWHCEHHLAHIRQAIHYQGRF